VIAGIPGKPGSASESDTHGGFDNDPATLNSLMFRILDGDAPHKFELRDLQFETGKDAVSRRRRRAGTGNAWGMVPSPGR
jgi:hypothetical protein